MDKDWHSGHFCCWQCDESLTGQRYVIRDDHPYCIKCYENVFANTCEECNKTIGIDSKVNRSRSLISLLLFFLFVVFCCQSSPPFLFSSVFDNYPLEGKRREEERLILFMWNNERLAIFSCFGRNDEIFPKIDEYSQPINVKKCSVNCFWSGFFPSSSSPPSMSLLFE